MSSSRAHVFVAPVDHAKWIIEPSRLECTLWQAVPSYGRAIFKHRAGETQKFMLETKRNVVSKGSARLEAIPPEWKPEFKDRDLGKANIVTGNMPLTLEEPRASRVLAELQLGMFPSIHHAGWFPGHTVHVMVSSVNFGTAYADYLDCITTLLPANFDQLEKSTILFDTDKWIVKQEFQDRMKLLKLYTDVDKRVKKIYVDGHTDSVGRLGYNWDLSRNRAEAVKHYLSFIGFPDDMVVLRYHGEALPVVKNNTQSNRQRNRRVTLRLEIPGLDR